MSPIKRLQQQRPPAFPRIGELRKGAPRPENGRSPGADLHHFRFTAQPGEQAIAERFSEIYGDQPTEINVYLPYGTADQAFEAWQEEWVAGGLVHRCDGESCVLSLEHGRYTERRKPCPGGCKQVGRLAVIIPELKRLAHVTVLTTSLHDIISLTEQLQAAEGVARLLGGDLRGIPFVLRRRPRMVSTPDERTGKRSRREKWLLSIEPSPDWVDRLLAGMTQIAAPSTAERPALMAPREVAESDEQIGTWPGAGNSDHDDEPDDWQPPEPSRTPSAGLSEIDAFVREIRALAEAKASQWPTERPCSEKQAGYVRGLLDGGDRESGKTERVAILHLLFDREADHLTGAQASALIDWCRRTPDYLARLRRLAAIAQGQEALPL